MTGEPFFVPGRVRDSEAFLLREVGNVVARKLRNSAEDSDEIHGIGNNTVDDFRLTPLV